MKMKVLVSSSGRRASQWTVHSGLLQSKFSAVLAPAGSSRLLSAIVALDLLQLLLPCLRCQLLTVTVTSGSHLLSVIVALVALPCLVCFLQLLSVLPCLVGNAYAASGVIISLDESDSDSVAYYQLRL